MSVHSVTNTNGALEWDTATMPMPGESVLGDRAVVNFAAEHVLLAAIDGVGHGPEAAAAAQLAADTLTQSEQDVASAALECHRALAHTRGAAMSLCSIDGREHTLTWLGIGNVETRLLHGGDPVPGSESLLLHTGVVGHVLPRLDPQTLLLAHGDVLIFATDGIRRDFADDLFPRGSCGDIADRILQDHRVGSDDALVLVARYLCRK
ncbi:MAG TPA: SpoIIE family protein phosphatase [Solirubrobacteraceae bacterium]|nr:SpoIIE family protein phosphatase [Solirubrobacteraceae bacterium]